MFREFSLLISYVSNFYILARNYKIIWIETKMGMHFNHLFVNVDGFSILLPSMGIIFL